MAWTVSDDPVDFDEAIAFFRDLVPMSDQEYDELTGLARERAFKVAGVAQLDVVHHVWEALERAIADGTDFDDFVAAISESLESAWGGSVANPGWRIETIFRTNVQTAYAAGRYAQATDPDVAEDRTYWMFDAIVDSRTSEICEDCNGTVRPSDDPWWKTHLPPMHHACRSTFITLTDEQAEAMGVTKHPPSSKAATGFGDPPSLDGWSPRAADYPVGLRGFVPS